MIVDINGIKREVSILKSHSEQYGNIYTGTVGKAKFYWITSATGMRLPNINIPGTKLDDTMMRKCKKLVAAFVTLALDMMKEDGNTSPMHFSTYDREVYVNSEPKERAHAVTTISGVPVWMKQEHKVWTKCRDRKTGEVLYIRRTRFKEESKEIVTEYISFCCSCINRSFCLEPCANPSENINKINN